MTAESGGKMREAMADFLSDKYMCRQLDHLEPSYLVKTIRKEVVRAIEAVSRGPPVLPLPPPPPKPKTPPLKWMSDAALEGPGGHGVEWKDELATMRAELDDAEGHAARPIVRLGDAPWVCKLCGKQNATGVPTCGVCGRSPDVVLKHIETLTFIKPKRAMFAAGGGGAGGTGVGGGGLGGGAGGGTGRRDRLRVAAKSSLKAMPTNIGGGGGKG